RRVAAATRELLVDLAADAMSVERASLACRDGKIWHEATGKSLDYGSIAKGRSLTKTISEDTPETPSKDWKVAGQSIEKINGRTFVTGGHKYTSDISRLGMLHGKVLRPASLGATLLSVVTDGVRELEGVVVVRDGEFVGAAALSESLAAKAVRL